MSLATLPRPQARTRAYVVVEYTTADGVTLRVRVSPEVAAVLATEGAPLREMTLTDLAGRKRRRKDDGRPGLDPELMLEGVARRVAKRRIKESRGLPPEGPNFRFARVLGEGRIWAGPPEPGTFCGWDRLAPDTVCLCCDRSGRDRDIPRPTPADLALRGRLVAYEPGALKGGKG